MWPFVLATFEIALRYIAPRPRGAGAPLPVGSTTHPWVRAADRSPVAQATRLAHGMYFKNFFHAADRRKIRAGAVQAAQFFGARDSLRLALQCGGS